MKSFKVLLVVLVLGAVLAALPGCQTAKATTAAAVSQEAAVIRGNLTKEISAAGNLALSHMEDLAVDLFYPAGTKGTIGDVLVEEGDSVTKGQVLVTLDKGEWNDQLALLEDAVIAKERALIQSQINLKTSQQTLVTANETILSRQSAVLSAEVALTQAQNAILTAITTVDFPAIVAAYNKTKAWYERISTSQGTMSSSDWAMAVQTAKDQLDVAKTNYDNALSGYTSAEVTLKKKQITIAENALTAAKQAVLDAQNDIPLKELNLQLAEGNLEDAQKALVKANSNLAEAKAKSPEITAPFDGIITKISVAGGDEVLNGTVAAQIADPDKFEADILVSERDIPQVKIGGQATVIADALTGTFLTATVTHISPTATISSGVVNYNVKVEVQSPGSSSSGAFGGFPAFSGNASGTRGGFPAMSGNTSTPGGFPAFSGNTSGKFDVSAFSGNMSGFPGMSSGAVELRQGFTVTVSITIASRTNVLMVPVGAVITEGFNSYVQVIGTSGALEKRQVTTGISNWQYTEILTGLKEGEKVQVTLNTAPSTNFGGGGAFFMGR